MHRILYFQHQSTKFVLAFSPLIQFLQIVQTLLRSRLHNFKFNISKIYEHITLPKRPAGKILICTQQSCRRRMTRTTDDVA